MTLHARGTFEVNLSPDQDVPAGLGRLTISKQFQGDLTATSVGQMLSAGHPETGSAGYVALERVTGTLAGRRGEFFLQHSGTMTRGKPSLQISVVPDSGTGELIGLSGTLNIDIVDGKHFYGFDYELAAAE